MFSGKCAVVLAAVVVSRTAVAVSRIAVAQAPQEFDKTCSGCHSEAQIKGMAKKYDAATLRTHALKPALLESTESFKVADLTNVKWADAKVKHGRLLENYTPAQVANLSAYLTTLK